MRRTWLRLVVCVSLTAFLAANTHVGAALARHWLAGSSADELRHSAEGQGCCQCAHLKTKGSDASQAPRHQGSPSCPDCPGTPSDSKCPCPGGCALCSVAKVPCSAPAAGLPSPARCMEASWPEPGSFYIPPFSGRLIRPPRA